MDWMDWDDAKQLMDCPYENKNPYGGLIREYKPYGEIKFQLQTHEQMSVFQLPKQKDWDLGGFSDSASSNKSWE